MKSCSYLGLAFLLVQCPRESSVCTALVVSEYVAQNFPWQTPKNALIQVPSLSKPRMNTFDGEIGPHFDFRDVAAHFNLANAMPCTT